VVVMVVPREGEGAGLRKGRVGEEGLKRVGEEVVLGLGEGEEVEREGEWQGIAVPVRLHLLLSSVGWWVRGCVRVPLRLLPSSMLL